MHGNQVSNVNVLRMVFAALMMPTALGATEIDTSFGSKGWYVFEESDGTSRQVNNAILQHDGKIVVVGNTQGGEPRYLIDHETLVLIRDLYVARFNPDGTFDKTFNGNGLLTMDLGGGTDDRGYAIAEQPDGKLVVAAQAQRSLDVSTVVVRLNADGSLDTSFNRTGVATFPQMSSFALAIQNDGKLLLGGIDKMVRLLSDGTLDASYGGSGTGIAALPKSADYGSFEIIYDIALQPDGNAVAVSLHHWLYAEIYEQPAAMRLDASGLADSTFGVGGFTKFSSPAFKRTPLDVLVAPDRSMLVASTGFWVARDGSEPPTNNMTGEVVRLTADGKVDTTFGSNGTAANVTGHNDSATSIALDAVGRILVGGQTAGNSNNTSDLVVSRLLPNGQLDASFGKDGHIVVGYSEPGIPYSSEVEALLLQPDGRVMIVGERSGADGKRILLARLCDPGVQFASSTPVSVSESASVVNLTVRRTCGASTGPVSVNVATIAGTASAEADFIGVNSTITWAAGDPDDKTVAIQILRDKVDEPDEQFTVALTDAKGGTLGAANTTTVTITNSGDPPSADPPKGGGGALGYGFLTALLLALGVARGARTRLPRVQR